MARCCHAAVSLVCFIIEVITKIFQTTQDNIETILGPIQEQANAFHRYMDRLMNRLRKDTQKPELDDLRLEVSYTPL